ncbi:MAG: hypothetical protein TREMPRED_003420 [Tremellales sp. Tagirdzhanova-0007]|nr:MAG: hypothetical protein TREMPRED_003420 [Tremellales sp. Tagirdzhanova-0007]
MYRPSPVEHSKTSEVKWGQLKERWVGWGVEIPGEQSWARPSVLLESPENVTASSLTTSTGQPLLPNAVHSKYPLPGRGGDYLGALIKVYDEVSYRPASTYTFVGIVSSSTMPSPFSSDNSEEPVTVPAIHVLAGPEVGYPIIAKALPEIDASPIMDIRPALIDYLATAFNPPDPFAAEYLLLLLISNASARPASLRPLGTLAVNFLRSASSGSTSDFTSIISSVTPLVVPLPLSISLLHSANFSPVSNEFSSLDAGLLQLGAGTVLIVEEDEMKEGGQLGEKAVKNLRALVDCTSQQNVRYEYPYMEGLKMDCDVKVAVLSEGNSLLPADVRIPLSSTVNDQTLRRNTSAAELKAFRDYLVKHSSTMHCSRLVIPEDVSLRIQDDFVRSRKAGALRSDARERNVDKGVEIAEDKLKRQMRVARLLALSYPAARLNMSVWERTVALDEEVDARVLKRGTERRDAKLGKRDAA